MTVLGFSQAQGSRRAGVLEIAVLRFGFVGLGLVSCGLAFEEIRSGSNDWWGVIQVGVAALLTGLMLAQKRHSVHLIALAGTVAVGLHGGEVEPYSRWPVVALVTLPLLAMAFAREKPMIVLAIGAALAVGFAATWPQAYPAGTLCVLAVAVLGLGLIVIRTNEEQRKAARRSSALFSLSPTPMIDVDYRKVLDEFKRMADAGVVDIRRHFRENPGLVTELVMLIRRVTANQAMAKLFDYETISEFLSVGYGTSLSLEVKEMFVDVLAEVWRGNFEFQRVMSIPTSKGKHLWLDVRCFAHPERPGRMLATLVDVSELEENRAKLRELLRSKDQFVASISHELRTPLSAVLGFLTTLNEQRDALSPHEIDEFLSHATLQAGEVSNIVEDLLVAARADVKEISVSLGAMDVVAEARAVVAVTGRFEVQGRRDVPTVCADPMRYRQIIRNLVTNAIRYGGEKRRIGFVPGHGSVAIEVRDNGPEIDSGTLEEMFSPYQRGAESDTSISIGLGLTVSKILAELMHGSLCAFRDGDETVFRLALPTTSACIHATSSTPHTN